MFFDSLKHRFPRYGRQVFYLTDSLYAVVVLVSIPAQIRQLILYYRQYKKQVDEFVRDLTFVKRQYKHFL